jgi:excisionase family DNA binding protein
MEDDLYAFSYAEVAARLGLSRSSVERLVRSGRLRVVSVWGRPRVRATELRRYLDALETTATGVAAEPRLRAVRRR